MRIHNPVAICMWIPIAKRSKKTLPFCTMYMFSSLEVSFPAHQLIIATCTHLEVVDAELEEVTAYHILSIRTFPPSATSGHLD